MILQKVILLVDPFKQKEGYLLNISFSRGFNSLILSKNSSKFKCVWLNETKIFLFEYQNVKMVPKLLFMLSIVLVISKSHGHYSQMTGQTPTIHTDMGGEERTYLHTDKDIYLSGDTIWFKVYLLDGITLEKSPKSSVVYVELLDTRDSIITKSKLYVKNMSSHSKIVLPKTQQSTFYRLRAYTKYMLSDFVPYFQKLIPVFPNQETLIERRDDFVYDVDKPSTSLIPNDEKKAVHIHFFPEGGTLVAGLSTTLALKITDDIGSPIDLEGTILNASGKTITNFKSNQGLALVYFKPDDNESYYAVINKDPDKKYFLPQVSSAGYSLSIKNRDKEVIVQLESTINNGLIGAILLGHIEEKQIIEHIFDDIEGNSHALKISTRDLPNGVAQFILFNPKGEPICKRMVFIDNKLHHVSISMNSQEPSKKEGTDLSISIQDSFGNAVKGDFSISISSSDSQIHRSEMKNWFLLSPELINTFRDVNIGWNKSSKESKRIMDAFMLVNENNNFKLDDVDSSDSVNNSHTPEKGIMLNGKVSGPSKNRKGTNQSVTLTILKNAHSEKQVTDKNGAFSFGPYSFNGKATAILQLDKTKDFLNDSISVDPTWPQVNRNMFQDKEKPSFEPSTKNLVGHNFNHERIEPEDYESDITFLDEVVVKEKRKTKCERIEEEISSFVPYGIPDIRVFRDSIRGWETLSAIDLLARRGLRVTGTYPNQTIGMSGGAPGSIGNEAGPLVLVDGSPTSTSFLSALRANEVLFIDVLRFSSATLYGVRGSAGVIAVYTNRKLLSTDYETPNKSMVKVEILGFDEETDFKSFHSGLKGRGDSSEYNHTLYWNPRIETDASGKYSMNFPKGDKAGTYVVEIEGITESGQIISELATFETEH